MYREHNKRGQRTGIVGIAAGGTIAAAVLLSGCSSGGGTSAGSGSSMSAAAGAPKSAGKAVVRVEVHSGPMGSFLTDGTGKTLYMFASDTSSKSTCTGACTSYWPALTTTGKVSAGGAARAADLGTIKQANGVMQVSYAGHPLYRFYGDGKPGDTNGQGRTDFGAHWWLLAPSGKPITGTSSSGSSPASSPASSSSKASTGGAWG